MQLCTRPPSPSSSCCLWPLALPCPPLPQASSLHLTLSSLRPWPCSGSGFSPSASLLHHHPLNFHLSANPIALEEHRIAMCTKAPHCATPKPPYSHSQATNCCNQLLNRNTTPVCEKKWAFIKIKTHPGIFTQGEASQPLLAASPLLVDLSSQHPARLPQCPGCKPT